MKRRQRRPVLTLNKPQNRYKQVSSVQSVQHNADNPLASLLCQYNSDSDTEDPKKDAQKLDDQVNDFFKEIQLIAPERSILSNINDSNVASKTTPQSVHHTNQQSLWQECYDESTGYPYYWHVETNEVTWDMPEELQLMKKQSEMSCAGSAKPSTQGPHWIDFSSITYRQSQTDVPEGMIPQEVVTRNRNRLIHKTAKKCYLETKLEIKNECSAEDDDSDDGRIEMITSFGSDGSDSEDEKSSLQEKKISTPTSESGNSNSASHSKSSEIGPTLCPVGMQSSTDNLSRPYKFDSANISDHIIQSQQSDGNRIIESDNKNNATRGKEFSMENKDRKDLNIQNRVPKLDINVSLVPGYGDDSDGEEEIRPKQEVKPLFPISQDEEYVTNSLKDVHGIISKNSSNMQSSDQSNDSNADIHETKEDNEKIEEKESKVDEDKSKTNIFLENMQVCGKAFQRKKRIAFDVTSTKIKQNNVHHDNASQDDNDLTNNEITIHNAEDNDEGMHNQPSTESQKDYDETNEEAEQCSSIKLEENLNSKNEPSSSEIFVEHETVSKSVEEKDNGGIDDLSQIITEKLKFLSEGRESVSAVQTMQIQLQTLSAAWGANSLEESYFQKWLANTSHELERLEQEAAPAGWLCQWDRSHKRYYYHNTSIGTSQWTYPDTGIVGGTEEMELCTTPPPPESEELSITGSPTTRKTKEKQPEVEDLNKMDDENVAEKRLADLEAPPSPQISNPSPPPPPRIFAEDLKKDKRKNEKPDEYSEIKRKRLGEDGITTLSTTQAVNSVLESLSYAHSQGAVSPQASISSNHTNMEPLPPGVDIPDTSYETAALKGIIYNTASQQSNALYTHSIGDPTIPIISHQAGLLQEPFIHYPAFHQHLHNHTAIAVANKHGGQNAIQFMVGYTPIYTNNKIITKPPVKASKESLGSALDSFYNDIARIEKTETERAGQYHDTVITERVSLPTEEVKMETEQEIVPSDTTAKERKKKKARISNSKKHKEMSTMVAKWQRVQKNLEDSA